MPHGRRAGNRLLACLPALSRLSRGGTMYANIGNYQLFLYFIFSPCKKTSIIRTSWLKHSQGVCPVTLDLKNSRFSLAQRIACALVHS
ncbi:MAG: hypothetical protein A2275_03640 [Bacteroidetes bacterium RIFOXYA12_FULL_35_11]|nr:MAG: hypothetical protein A2X01_05400 [Bacteroidetes bacterium GWF2_35_48]OFY81960.1 MAG: hypothetical protein A2275_03640 [Bacteroidetes bacterium RIFOXYA12_FULL_35_11]OFY95726.1 MAG: hypothetical protein A2491_08640 [Bacteroidetes bacterium RIFOXYC12_FULL_35_7]HBX52190.1 hypothetical protein [Bacteroidales bacterium]